MFELIFIFFIVYFAVKNSKKKNTDGNRNNQSYGINPSQSYSGQRQYVQQQPQQTQRKPATAQKKPVATKPAQPMGDELNRSTTGYLHQKAIADQREHAKEKMDEKKRLSEKYGGRAVAMRYLPGDRVPSGMRVVNCSYCNAENLVETMRTDRACYFCRTKL